MITKTPDLTREDFALFCDMLKDAGLSVTTHSPIFADVSQDGHLYAQIKLCEGLIGTTDRIPGFTVQPYYNGALRYSVCI
jgi:hypothetical protein